MGWGLRLRTLLTGVMILLACQVGEVLAAAQIKSVRIWRAPDNTRLVFDLSGPVQHSLFTLAAPNRIVIDVSGAQLATQLNGLKLGNTPITAVRSAQRTPNDLRMVLDLSAQVTQKLRPAAKQYGNRLVVDLYDQGADLTPDVPATPTPSVPVTPVTPTQPVAKLPLPTKGGTRDIVIAIDAGHGGEDPGALGPGGLHEKNITLSIARELQRQINQVRGYRAELTRTGDYFIPLRKRTEIARKKGADLFVSIHADAAPSRSAFGASVFALSDRGATSENRALAGRQREPFRPDRRRWQRQPRRQGPDARRRAARPVDDRHPLVEPGCRPQGTDQCRPHHFAAQASCRAGRVHGAEVAGHPIDPGGNRLHLERQRVAQAG